MLNFLSSYIDANSYAPSASEMQRHFKLRSKATILKHLTALEKKQFIRRPLFRSNAIQLLRPAPAAA